ncbi:hypothetical protein NESM_000767100 [Novymonas esmeraldas]|uniref:Uncharacterized protein n=1 Tax=Novymonas esmeraldas TaxID=1808958 RepID=A0AAW0EV52_9TRYP
MYSDDNSEVSSTDSGAAPPRLNPQNNSSADRKCENDDYYYEDDECDSDRAAEEPYAAVGESAVPLDCLERCVVFVDCALFDPMRPPGDPNERVVECSMRVVQYPFVSPRPEATETMLYTAEVSTSNMTKVVRAQTAQRWIQLIKSHHGVPCFPEGTTTGFTDLHNTVRTFRVYVEEYCHSLQRAKAKRVTFGKSSAADDDTRVLVALKEEEIVLEVPKMLRRVIDAATRCCQAEKMPHQIAFLTTGRRRDEVCRGLLWLQSRAKVSLPPYQVFTVQDLLGKDWETLVTRELAHFNCGYHSYLMTNEYGNRRHCCESTVSSMAHVLDAAVRQLR